MKKIFLVMMMGLMVLPSFAQSGKGKKKLVAIRIELAAEFVGIDAGSACNTGPGDLGRDVRDERVAADAEDVFGFPCVWRGACQFELDGERFVTSRNLGDKRIDASGKGLDAGACVGCVGVPFRLHVAAIEEEASGPVLLHIGGAEGFRQQAEASLAPEIDLPEAVTRGDRQAEMAATRRHHPLAQFRFATRVRRS